MNTNKPTPRERITAVLIGIAATVGWALIVILIGQL